MTGPFGTDPWRSDSPVLEMPMFPLGTVLFPHMPLALRLFEERYLTMLARLLEAEEPEFGVVLIERGQEMGGGEHRFRTGTVAEIVEVDGGEGFVAVIAEGGQRFEVTDWLPDDPYPRAEVRVLDELDWSDDVESLRSETETAVRRSLAVASEFSEQQWASVVELSDDPLESSWQLAGIAPVSDLDQMRFLAAGSLEELLVDVRDRATEAGEAFIAGALADADDDDEWGIPEA